MPFERVGKPNSKTPQLHHYSFTRPGSITTAQATHTQPESNLELPQLQHNFSEISVESSNPPIQANLNLGQPSDQYEVSQRKYPVVRQTSPIQAQESLITQNRTGIPNSLKASIENLSGMSMDDVRVHYNSSKPSQLKAAAYAQGTDIYIGMGQDKHLAHEAWHVVQQKQGRVKSNLQMHGVAMNDDSKLEQEADVMGMKAVQKARLDPFMPDTVQPIRSFSQAAKSEEAPAQKPSVQASHTQIFRLRSTKHQPDSSPIVQLVSYRVREPINGINMEVAINHIGNKIEVEDLTQSDRPVGKLRGFIEYQINRGQLRLDHFEAQPAGTGLGTLLMNIFAQFAVDKKFKFIHVNTPALTAMGAYDAFGGLFSDPELFARSFKMYLKAMEGDPGVHARFVKEEAKEIATHKVNREAYFDPGIGAVGRGNIYKDAYDEHIRKHPRGMDDYIRVARLMALSGDLMYESGKLLSLTQDKLIGKWEKVD